jgi:hypothetical protein
MGNSWPNGKDPNGKFFEILPAIVGFVTGFTEEAFSGHGNLGKDLEAGLFDALSSEVSFAFLGGGLGQGIGSDVGPEAAKDIVTGRAISFSASFVATDLFTYAQNYDQIKQANGRTNQDVGLIAGYGVTSAITAGFNSNFMQQKIDDVATGWGIHIPKIFAGAISQGIGGAISNAGNNILQNGDGWQASTGFSAISGFVSSFAGQVAHNGVNMVTESIFGKPKDLYPYYNFTKFGIIDLTKNFVANIASGVTQQYISNVATQFGLKNGYNTLGSSPDWWTFFGSGQDPWGAYINGLGGFQSDMYGDSHH